MAGPWKRVAWALEYAALCGVFALVRVLPERWWRALGRGLGRFAFRTAGLRRGVVLDNLRHAFPERTGAWRFKTAAAVFSHLGETMLEFFGLGIWQPADIRARVINRGLERVRAYTDQGQGVILTTGHFGNWELLGSRVAASGLSIHVVARTQSNPWADRLQNRLRNRAGMKVIKADSSVRQVIRAVRRGECVAMLPDVNAGDDGVFVEFLGRQAATPRGVAYFAWKLQCPLIPSFLLALGKGRHEAIFCEPIIPDPVMEEDEAVRTLTQQLMDRFAEQIRAHPDHYFWVHRRWKTRPPAASPVTTDVSPHGNEE